MEFGFTKKFFGTTKTMMEKDNNNNNSIKILKKIASKKKKRFLKRKEWIILINLGSGNWEKVIGPLEIKKKSFWTTTTMEMAIILSSKLANKIRDQM